MKRAPHSDDLKLGFSTPNASGDKFDHCSLFPESVIVPIQLYLLNKVQCTLLVEGRGRHSTSHDDGDGRDLPLSFVQISPQRRVRRRNDE